MFPLKEHGTQLTAEVQDRVRLPWWWPWRDISRPGPDLSDVLEGGIPKTMAFDTGWWFGT